MNVWFIISCLLLLLVQQLKQMNVCIKLSREKVVTANECSAMVKAFHVVPSLVSARRLNPAKNVNNFIFISLSVAIFVSPFFSPSAFSMLMLALRYMNKNVFL